MSDKRNEGVQDPKGLLAQQDHMREMERIPMEVLSIGRPYPSVTRVTGRIAPSDPATWALPNVAVRLEVAGPAPEGARPLTRIYTIRSFDPVQSTVEIDFVLHEDDSPAMLWLRDAAPGTELWLTGPRPHLVPGFAPGKQVALFADDTAIPAVDAILRAWPEGVRGAVWADVCEEAAMQSLPHVPGVERHMFLRAPGEAAGTTGRLFEAAQALGAASDWTVWAAGERGEMRRIRSHCLDNGWSRDDLHVVGYWKFGVSSSDIDRKRLEVYEAARARGQSLEEMMDSDEAL